MGSGSSGGPRPEASRFAIRTNLPISRRCGYRHAEAAIQEAFERGSKVGLMVGADWESMMEWRLDDVRAHLGIREAPPAYRPIPQVGEPALPEPTLLDLVRGVLSADGSPR